MTTCRVRPVSYTHLDVYKRQVGGWLADKLGGALLTFWVFALMIVGVFFVLHFLPDHSGQGGNFYGFLGSFMGLFVLSGIGNASTCLLYTSRCV